MSPSSRGRRRQLEWRSMLVLLASLAALPGYVRAAFATTAKFEDFKPVTAFPNRYAVHTCSLISASGGAPIADACRLQSLWGSSDGRLMVKFGETNCTISLKRCKKDMCYSMRDMSTGIPLDPITPGSPPGVSIFSDITIVSGATVVGNSRAAFAFKATSSRIVLRYSTQTCADFYRNRGRVPYQICEDFVGVSNINTNMPTDPYCRATLPTS